MKRRRIDPKTSESDERGAASNTASDALLMPPPQANAATLSIILRTLETKRSNMQKEIADIKETQLSIISSQRHLLNEIFAWIPLQTVFHYRRMSKTINQCLLTRQFAVLSTQTADFQMGLVHKMSQIWLHLPEHYRTVVASAMSGQLKTVEICPGVIESKGLPESITCLTKVEHIYLHSCKLTGNLPDGIGALQNLKFLDLSYNSLVGPLPSSFNLLVSLETLDLSNNQLTGEFPALPTLQVLEYLSISNNCFTGPIPTVNPSKLLHLFASHNQLSVIPATVSELTNLWDLKINNNSFACQIPPGIWNLQNLSFLDISNCKFSGLLAGVGNLWQLESLDVSNNEFSGELPSREIQNLELLQELHLIGNQFSGGEMLDMTGSKLCTMCVDTDIQTNYVIWRDEYLCSCEHVLVGDS